MTTTTTATRAAAHPVPASTPRVVARPTFAGAVRGEAIKLLSLRSTWWTSGITVALMALVALAQSTAADAILESTPVPPHGAEFVIGGWQFGVVSVAVLGALLMTGEYSTGMIRSSLQAAPGRWPVLGAKALTLTLATILVAALSITASYAVTAPFLDDHGLVPALDDPLTWQAFGGMTFFFVSSALLALGVAAVLRHTGGALTAVLGLLLLLPGALQFVPIDWVQDLLSVLPLPAAFAFLSITGSFGDNPALSPWQGVAVVGAYAAVALVGGVVRLLRSDA